MSIFIATPAQQQTLREGAKILKQVQETLKGMIAEGVTGKQLDAVAERIIRDAGAAPTFKGYGGFPATLCVMINDQIVHGIPSNEPLKNGDLLSIDCGVHYGGLHTDAAFSVVVGGGDKKPAREAFQKTVKAALEAGCEQAIVGNRVGAIGEAIERVIKKSPYSLCREYTGHGLGTELHMEPYVYNFGSRREGMVLAPGQVIAIEPIVASGKPENHTLSDKWTVLTDDGSDACQWEHCGIVHEDHFEILV